MVALLEENGSSESKIKNVVKFYCINKGIKFTESKLNYLVYYLVEPNLLNDNKEVADRLNLSEITVKVAKTNLQKDGLLLNKQYGKWEISSDITALYKLALNKGKILIDFG